MPLPGQEAPEDMFGAAGLALWLGVASEFLLDAAERAILVEACKVADEIEQMQVRIGLDGLLLPWGSGVRAHPLQAHLTAGRTLLTRLLVTLKIPAAEEEAEQTAQVRRRSFRSYRGGAG